MINAPQQKALFGPEQIKELECSLRRLSQNEPSNFREFLIWCKNCQMLFEQFEALERRNGIFPNSSLLQRITRDAAKWVRLLGYDYRHSVLRYPSVEGAIVQFENFILWCEKEIASNPEVLQDTNNLLQSRKTRAQREQGRSINRPIPSNRLASRNRGNVNSRLNHSAKSRKSNGPLKQCALWCDICIVMDDDVQKYFIAPTTEIIGQEVNLEKSVELQLPKGQLHGLLVAIAKCSVDGKSVRREHAHSKMPFKTKLKWKDNKSEAGKQLRQAVNSLSGKFRKEYVDAVEDSRPPFSYSATNDSVTCEFHVVTVEYLGGKTAPIVKSAPR